MANQASEQGSKVETQLELTREQMGNHSYKKVQSWVPSKTGLPCVEIGQKWSQVFKLQVSGEDDELIEAATTTRL